jgi:hypothetical protein
MSIFTCCERVDETKYFHTCGCPSASFTCESESIIPSLCGWQEAPYGAATVPPKKYTSMSVVLSGSSNTEPRESTCGDFSATFSATTEQFSGSAVYSSFDNADPPSCSSVNEVSFSLAYDETEKSVECNPPPAPNCDGCSVVSVATNFAYGYSESSIPYDSWWEGSYLNQTISKLGATDGINPGWYESNALLTKTISSEDTEILAAGRSTPSAGTSCSSLWSTRDTGFSWTKRTSSYEIECANLINGLQYLVTPTIEKRTAVIGSEGAWEDVTVSATTFTATSDTKSFAAVALGHIQGYEYQITGVTIEKT